MNNRTNVGSTLRTLSLVWLLLFAFCSGAFAQTLQVQGKVIDSKQEPLIGVNVVVKGTTNGTITDFDGNFTLTVTKGETLQFSYIGFTSKEVVANSSNLVVEMKEDTETLDEVVVVGYGTQKKGSLTGAITAVKSEDLVKLPLRQLLVLWLVKPLVFQPDRQMDVRVQVLLSKFVTWVHLFM